MSMQAMNLTAMIEAKVDFESPDGRTGRSDSFGTELLGNACPTSCLPLSSESFSSLCESATRISSCIDLSVPTWL